MSIDERPFNFLTDYEQDSPEVGAVEVVFPKLAAALTTGKIVPLSLAGNATAQVLLNAAPAGPLGQAWSLLVYTIALYPSPAGTPMTIQFREEGQAITGSIPVPASGLVVTSSSPIMTCGAGNKLKALVTGTGTLEGWLGLGS